MIHDPEEIARTYRRFAERECRGYSEAYYRLALDVAEDADIVDFLADLPVAQPNLFFASVQLLTGPDSMPRTGSQLSTFVRTRGPEVAGVMRARRTQTNEVGRCAVLLPALPPGPLALVEVGASAGLCLLLDRFGYELGSSRIGDAASPVHVRCAVTGPMPVPSTIPRVVWRRGLDTHPIDVRDDDAVRWLLACVWPDHPERRRRLEAAVRLARAEPPVVTAGDLVDSLPTVLAGAPQDATLVVFHSAVLSYVAMDRRRAFVDALAEASRRRPLVWVSIEALGVVPDVEAKAPSPSDQLRFLLHRADYTDGQRRDRILGFAHPHGSALSWLGPHVASEPHHTPPQRESRPPCVKIARVPMKKPVDLYDSHYGQVEADVYRAVREDAFGEDLGQASWITRPECDEFCRWLGLRESQRMLEVACGSGGTAAHIAGTFGVSVVGVDVNPSAIQAASQRAARAAHGRIAFRVADADETLPFADGSFDAVFCNDSINHLRDRARVLADWHRVLRPGGRCLYTDPIVMTGALSNAEVEARSSVGFFLFTPSGVNEARLREAGFRVVLTADVTAAVARTSGRWHEARARRRSALCELEGEPRFDEVQRFLAMVHTLASERRLSRFAFVGEKAADRG